MSRCALSHALSGAIGTAADGLGGRGSQRQQRTNGDQADRHPVPQGAADVPGTKARAASTAPQGSTAAISYGLLSTGTVEITYAEMLMTIATHSSWSARLAVRQVIATRAKPAAAPSKQASPRTYPATPPVRGSLRRPPPRTGRHGVPGQCCVMRPLPGGRDRRLRGGHLVRAEMPHHRADHGGQRYRRGGGQGVRGITPADLPCGHCAVAAH